MSNAFVVTFARMTSNGVGLADFMCLGPSSSFVLRHGKTIAAQKIYLISRNFSAFQRAVRYAA